MANIGRPKGSKNKRKVLHLVGGIERRVPPAIRNLSPMEFMLKCMNDPEFGKSVTPLQFEAAKQLLPYVHAKVQPKPEIVEQVKEKPMSDMELARRIAFALRAMQERIIDEGPTTIEGEAS